MMRYCRDMVQVRIAYLGLSSGAEESMPEREFVVSGDADESFVSAAWRAIGHEYSREIFVLRLPSALSTVSPIIVTERMTLAEVAAFADGNSVPLTYSRVGGQWISDLFTFAVEGLTLYSLVDALKRMVNYGRQLQFKKHRDEARIWASSGTEARPSMQLTRMVMAQSAWSMQTIMRMFDLDRQEARALLVRLGYVYDDSDDIWYEGIAE